MNSKFFRKNKLVVLYGASLALLLFFLKWLELKVLIMNNAYDIYVGLIALLFTGLGIWLALKLVKPKVHTVVVEKEVYVGGGEFNFNEAEFKSLGISNRELEVLKLMAEGLSNQEIAERLFVSLNTVKTHTSGLFSKLDVKRRTQAVELGKRLNLIP
jgi:NarL family two-component system response regulator LiaR